MEKLEIINRELTELIEVINKDIKFIKETTLELKKLEGLNEFIDFRKVEFYLRKYKENIDKINNINIIREYNNNFYKYIKEEKNKFFQYYLNHYNNENLKECIYKIKSGEISYNNIKINKSNYGYGGGRPPMNKDEELVYQLMQIEFNMRFFLDNINDFINNINILKDFSEIDTNVVIIGSNGSGKSTLSRRLKIDNINQSINIIPSHHILYLTSDDFIIPRYLNEKVDINEYQNETKLVTEQEPFDSASFVNSFHILLNYLINDHNFQKGDTNNDNCKKTILEKTLETSSEILKKNIIIKNNIIVCNDCSNIYDFNQMSDGERQVFYFVASVLANEKDGYIIIDEPENHLNSQVCKSLWDKLEMLKSNSTFVYITHDPKFAVSRANSKIIWSRSFIYPDKWEYTVLENNEIPEELLVEVLGSKENVIFCEGKDLSLDKQIYDSIFLKEKVIPVEGHLNVISYTKAINNMPYLNINAKGIIDRDGKTVEEINHYTQNNIYVTPFNEVEMLLLCDDVLIETNREFEQYQESINIDEWKTEIFKRCSEYKEKILTNIIKSRIENKLCTEKIQKSDNIENIKNELNRIVGLIDVDEVYNKESERMQDILDNKKYSELLEMCNLKNHILKHIPNKFRFHNYENKALGIIKKNNKLRESLKNKYFIGV